MIDLEPTHAMWSARLVRMPRTVRAYKPAMLLVALDLIDEGAPASHIPLAALLDRFDELLARASLPAVGKGFQPACHLADQLSPVPFWTLLRGETRVGELSKPSSNGALLRAADAVAFLPELAVEAETLEARQAIRLAIYELLDRDDDDACHALVRCHDTSYADVQADRQRLGERLLVPFLLDDPAPRRCLTQMQRRSRRRAFTKHVLDAYGRACALCELRIQWGNLVEAEAAHIKPHSLDGVDDLRNGLALCRTHHWSFDRGLWTATDAATVEVVDSAAAGTAELTSLQRFHGKRLRSPDPIEGRPHRDALAWHRAYLFRVTAQGEPE